jgi:uncharacterized YccA/Bax inhibitor family protein
MARLNTRRSGNPFMKESIMQNASVAFQHEGHEAMTVNGAINKTFLLFGIMLITTYISYMNPSGLFIAVGAIGGLIAVIVASIKRPLSPFVAPIYALLEGLFVGAITARYAMAYNNIVIHAVTLTISMLLLMLIIYRLNIIPVTNKLRTGVFMATGAVVLVYVLSWVLSFFGIQMPMLHQGGMIGIGISLVIIGIAAFNLLIDFDMFEKGAEYGAPRYMEWFLGMGLLITLIWLYVEILRLLSILNRD